MKKKIIWIVVILILGTPIFLIYLTFINSKGCNQFVIDTYELYSGINIPEVELINCYYDEDSNTRISIYKLKAQINLSTFEFTKCSSQKDLLHGISLLDESERPNNPWIYVASGRKWGAKWTYAVDNDSQTLWTELDYGNF